MNIQALEALVLQLLPRGMNTLLGDTLKSLLLWFADLILPIYLRLEEAIVQIIDPRHATTLLPEWEADLGLPDTCSVTVDFTQSERQLLAHQKLTQQGQNTIAYLQSVINSKGFTSTTIAEYGLGASIGSPIGTPITSPTWSGTLIVTSPLFEETDHLKIGDPVGTPLRTFRDASALTCLLRRIRPAHLALVYQTE